MGGPPRHVRKVASGPLAGEPMGTSPLRNPPSRGEPSRARSGTYYPARSHSPLRETRSPSGCPQACPPTRRKGASGKGTGLRVGRCFDRAPRAMVARLRLGANACLWRQILAPKTHIGTKAWCQRLAHAGCSPHTTGERVPSVQRGGEQADAAPGRGSLGIQCGWGRKRQVPVTCRGLERLPHVVACDGQVIRCFLNEANAAGAAGGRCRSHAKGWKGYPMWWHVMDRSFAAS